MRPAAAQMFIERRDDVRAARTRFTVEQRLRGNQKPPEAKTAPAGPPGEHRLLDRMQLPAVRQTFDRGDALARDRRDLARAGVDRLARQQTNARPAPPPPPTAT